MKLGSKITLPRELSQCAIDGYICTVEGCLSTENYQTWTFLNRAIDLALLVKDTQRVEKIKHIAFAYTRNQPKSWWELNSLVWEKKGLTLSGPERDELIGWLEDALISSSNINDPTHFNPHEALNAADLLQCWYKKLKQTDLGVTALKKAGAAFEGLAVKNEYTYCDCMARRLKL